MSVVHFHIGDHAGLSGVEFAGTVAAFRAEVLKHVVLPRKDAGGAWVPVYFPPGSRTRRKSDVVGASSSLWLDADGLDEGQLERLFDLFREMSWEGEAWSTFSYEPGVKTSVRVRLTVDRPHASADEVTKARRGFEHFVCRRLGLTRLFDRKVNNPNAIFYVPAVSPDRTGTERVWFFDGNSTPKLDDLCAIAHELDEAEAEKKRVARARVESSGTSFSSEDDAKAFDAYLEDRLRWLRGAFDDRKNGLFHIGGQIRANAAAGTADAAKAAGAVRALIDEHLDGDAEYHDQFDGGLERGEKTPITAGSVEVERDVKVWDSARKALEDCPPATATLEEARAQVSEAISRGFSVAENLRKLIVVEVEAGVGKTTALAAAASANALLPVPIPTGVAVPNHRVGGELTRRLPLAAREVVVHAHNPLRDVEGSPSCMLTDRQKAVAERQMYVYGAKQYNICRACPFANTCEAKKAWETRNKRLRSAPLGVVSYQNFAVLDPKNDLSRVFAVDEMPSLVERRTVKPEEWRAAATLPVLPDDLHAWVKALENRKAFPTRAPTYSPTLNETLSRVFEVAESGAAAVVQFAQLALASGAAPERRPDGAYEVAAPSALVSRLKRLGGLLATATPELGRLDDARVDVEVISVRVAKHPNHVRVFFPWANAGREKFRAKTRRGTTLGQSILEEAGRRVSSEAGEGRGLLVSFKEQVEGLTDVPSNVDVAYYGAIKGLNDWEAHTAVLCVGTPWDQHVQDAKVLELEGAEAWAYGRRQAANEVYQALERLRTVSRPEERLWLGAIGNVVPRGWSADSTELRDWAEDVRDLRGVDGRGLLARLVAGGWSKADIARSLGVDKSALSRWGSGRLVPAAKLSALAALPPSPSRFDLR